VVAISSNSAQTHPKGCNRPWGVTAPRSVTAPMHLRAGASPAADCCLAG
jgi:hypothetical protein